MWRFLVCSSLVALTSAQVVYQRLTDCTDDISCARDDDGWHGCKDGIGENGNPQTYISDGNQQETAIQYMHLWLGGRAQHTIIRFRRVDYVSGVPLTVRVYPSQVSNGGTALWIRALKRWDPARTAGNHKLNMRTRNERTGLKGQFSGDGGKSLGKYMEDPNEYTEAKVLWEVPAWRHDNIERVTLESTTPDLQAIAEEMLTLDSHPWASGQPLAFVFTAAQCAVARETDGSCSQWEERDWMVAGNTGNNTNANNKCRTIQVAAGTEAGLRVYAFDGQSSKAAEVSAYGGVPDAAAQPVAIIAMLMISLTLFLVF